MSRELTAFAVRAASVWLALCALLLATFVLAYVPLATLQSPVALSIAAAEALLVGAIFMELRKASTVARLAALAGVIWLSILFALTFTDQAMRPHFS